MGPGKTETFDAVRKMSVVGYLKQRSVEALSPPLYSLTSCFSSS